MGGIALIHISGPQAVPLVLSFLRSRSTDRPVSLPPDRLVVARWVDDGQWIDDVVVVAGSTRQGAAEVCLSTHGGIRVVQRVLLGLKQRGVIVREANAAAAWPGCSALEACVLDALPRADTGRAVRWLLRQLEELPRQAERCRQAIQSADPTAALAIMDALEAGYSRSQMLLNGARVAIVGAPNVGKSTLANRLLNKPWSIESDQPGTTRDWVDRPTSFCGVPISLIDTAGIRDTVDPLEQAAIDGTRPVIDQADVQIVLLDATCPPPDPAVRIIAGLDPAKVLLAYNKVDLRPDPPPLENINQVPVPLAAAHGIGLDLLRRAVLSRLGFAATETDAPAIWDPRQAATLAEVRRLCDTHATRAAALLESTF